MSSDLLDIRTLLAASPHARVDLGRDGVLHVLVGPLTLHLDRPTCEELATTLARAMVTLAKSDAARRRRAKLALVPVPRVAGRDEETGVAAAFRAPEKSP